MERRRHGHARPRVLFVNNTTYDLPLPPGLDRGWDAISERLDVRVVGRKGLIEEPDERFRLVDGENRALGRSAFYAALGPAVATEVRRFRPDVLTTQSPHEAFACLGALAHRRRRRPKLLVQVHADWRGASRLYGSGLRRSLAPMADLAAARALRCADGIRAVGPYTARLARDVTGREPIASYPGFSNLGSFRRNPVRPLPATPTIGWVAMLERTKNLDGFAAAWREVADRVPAARLTLVGQGRLQALVDDLVRDYPARVVAVPRLSQDEVADVLDASTALVLPSRSEGAGRVVMEAFLRGRPVVGANVGGIPDLVKDGHNGLLIDPEDPTELATALVRVLEDPDLAARLSGRAADTARDFDWTPERLAGALTEVVGRLGRDTRGSSAAAQQWRQVTA